MRNIDTFLGEIAASRQRAQIAERAALVATPDLSISPALEVALRHRFLISPVLAQSPSPHHSAYVGEPSCDRKQIEYWVATLGNVNRSLQIGEKSRVVALEIEDLCSAVPTLTDLADEDSSWQDSLQFTIGPRRFVLFEYAPFLRPLIGFAGIKLHIREGNRIPIPPSNTALYEIAYIDISAPLLPVPAWLR
jgi:hypothetical protein